MYLSIWIFYILPDLILKFCRLSENILLLRNAKAINIEFINFKGIKQKAFIEHNIFDFCLFIIYFAGKQNDITGNTFFYLILSFLL